MWCWASLGTEQLLGGEIRLDRAAAAAAVGRLGSEIGLSAERMAEGILRVAVVSMAAAIKEVSVLRGIDPRDFALLSYGGAGPLQAAAIADELGMRTVVVPPMPGNFSAFGLLVADVRRDLVRTKVATIDDAFGGRCTGHAFGPARGRRAGAEGCRLPAGRRRFAATLDMRYAGQSFELSVPVDMDLADTAEIVRAFEKIYEIATAARRPRRSRSSATASLPGGCPTSRSCRRSRQRDARWPRLSSSTRTTIFDGASYAVPVVDRERMPPGEAVDRSGHHRRGRLFDHCAAGLVGRARPDRLPRSSPP